MKLLLDKKQFNRVMFQLLALLGLGVWLFGMPGCVPRYVPPPLPQSEWGERYAFSYDLQSPARPAASVPVTIAVVNPSYKVEDSILNTELYRKVGKGLSISMGTDLDKILINKGITTTGPFPSLDEMTYSDKKNAALTLAPQVFITMEIKNVGPPRQIGNPYGRAKASSPMFAAATPLLAQLAVSAYQNQQGYSLRSDQTFEMNITGWISFIMQEPLSGEKMWIKKLEIDTVAMTGTISTESIPQYGDDGCGGQIVTGYTPGKILYDGRPDALASALKQMYPVVLSQFEKYIDPNELIELKGKGQEIRSSNVFIGK